MVAAWYLKWGKTSGYKITNYGLETPSGIVRISIPDLPLPFIFNISDIKNFESLDFYITFNPYLDSKYENLIGFKTKELTLSIRNNFKTLRSKKVEGDIIVQIPMPILEKNAFLIKRI